MATKKQESLPPAKAQEIANWALGRPGAIRMATDVLQRELPAKSIEALKAVRA